MILSSEFFRYPAEVEECHSGVTGAESDDLDVTVPSWVVSLWASSDKRFDSIHSSPSGPKDGGESLRGSVACEDSCGGVLLGVSKVRGSVLIVALHALSRLRPRYIVGMPVLPS